MPFSRYLKFSNAATNAKNHHHHHHNHSLETQLVRLLKQCTSTTTLKQVHAQMVLNNLLHPNHLLSKLIHLNNLPYAKLLFSRISPHPNDYAFNIMIRALTTTATATATCHDYHLALSLFRRMTQLGLRPNNFTFPFFFLSCANLDDLLQGRLGHSSVLKLGLLSDHHTCHSMITMYARCRELRCARKVFDEIAEKDLVSWNSMISGYARVGFAREAVVVFGEMRGEGFVPDEVSAASVLGACGEIGDLELGRWVEAFVVERGMEVNSYVGSALISMYGKCGELGSARRIFDGMVKRDVITWNALISGYTQNGMADEAISLFHAMKEEKGVNPNKITLSAVLSACANIGALDLGRQIDEYVSQRGFRHDVFVGTALIDMYAKSGSLDSAQRVFNEMPRKNEASWNAMISALASHGKAREALSLFQRMFDEGGGARPNDITFVGLLSACVHAGLVAEGYRLFDMMSSLFGLVPKIEHYSCMVDLLSRAGHLYEAWDLIEKMPEKPDKVTLGALHGACRRLKNVDIGERVTQLLLELDPLNSGNYIISSKIYANLNMWDDSARMRLLMRQKGVSKTPGCSWIEIENQLHEFHAGDGLHVSSNDIYGIIDLLYAELKREGYVPKIVE